jgi:hypothetical protein
MAIWPLPQLSCVWQQVATAAKSAQEQLATQVDDQHPGSKEKQKATAAAAVTATQGGRTKTTNRPEADGEATQGAEGAAAAEVETGAEAEEAAAAAREDAVGKIGAGATEEVEAGAAEEAAMRIISQKRFFSLFIFSLSLRDLVSFLFFAGHCKKKNSRCRLPKTNFYP